MELVDPLAVVSGAEELTRIFGYWPSFHDAEIIDVRLSRGEVDPDKDKFGFPTLNSTIHVWELTNEVGGDGCFALQKHTLVVLRFRDIENLRLDGFNHQNVIDAIEFSLEPRGTYTDGSPLPPHIFVEFVHIFGIALTFKCMGVELESARPCSPEGKVE